MPKIIDNKEALRRSLTNKARYEDGSKVQPFVPTPKPEAPKAVAPIPVQPPPKPEVIVVQQPNNDAEQIVAAIQALATKIPAPIPPKGPSRYEFTVTKRDYDGRIVKFTVTEHAELH